MFYDGGFHGKESQLIAWKDAKSPQRKFQLAEQLATSCFSLGEELSSTELQKMGISDQVLIVANTRVKPELFDLRGIDYQPISELVYPGKSAILDFLAIQTKETLTRDERNVCTERTFAKNSDRRDCVWHASVRDIQNASWRVFYAPTSTNGLHVRLVWKDHIGLKYPVEQDLSIPRFGLDRISKIWTRKKC